MGFGRNSSRRQSPPCVPGRRWQAGKQKWFLECVLVGEGVAASEQADKRALAVLCVDSLAE